MSKQILLINQTSALNSPCANEALDMALILASYDHQMAMLFEESAVLQLIKGQDAREVGSKDLFKRIKLLELYDVEQLFVCADAINRFGLQQADLAIDCDVLSRSQKAALFAAQDHLLRF